MADTEAEILTFERSTKPGKFPGILRVPVVQRLRARQKEPWLIDQGDANHWAPLASGTITRSGDGRAAPRGQYCDEYYQTDFSR